MRYERVKNETAIVHYAGYKPWDSASHVHYDIEKLWWDYAKLVPQYKELMETYIEESIMDSYMYDLVYNLLNENKDLRNLVMRLKEYLPKE